MHLEQGAYHEAGTLRLITVLGNPALVFRAKTTNSTEWKAVASAAKTLVEEATFEATPEGLTFRAMDPSHVALMDLSWPGSAFQTYECDTPYKFSLRVEDLVKLIARSEAKDNVEISSAEDNAILFRFINGYARDFTIHLIESTGASAPLPKVEFDNVATVTKTILEKILGDISVVSEQITVQSSDERLLFMGKSDIGSAEVSLSKSDAGLIDLKVGVESRATYSIEYLNSISKAMGNVADTVKLEYSAKKPVRLTFALNSQGSQLQFFLAPRVTD